MCISCRSVLPKEQLIRVAKMKDGTVKVADKGGRGVYVCNKQDCILKLKKSNGLSRGLKTNVPDEIYEECSNVR
ncbi:MAG: YlxR family protein [Clostridia bacterium]|nr:YlxR family protein [Clostridia bacterium]MBQ4543374.1 YlxR family protein [Clostridia bacterium]MBQ7075391.1 YlxR family protein [Clostridia bacterium]MBQ9997968.1 YlxR family protein [Clostridia bacterium]